MGKLLSLLIGAQTLRHLPMPKKIDHLLRRVQIALAAFVIFATFGVLAFIALIVYVLMAMTGALPR